MSNRAGARTRPGARIPGIIVIVAAALALPLAAAPGSRGLAASDPPHLVISEVVTGGAGASDELIEIYNPSAEALPLEGLELIYVSASGATISRRAAWDFGAPSVPPGGHRLLANELGIYAGIGDDLYASGIAAGGGTVAIRIQGATTAIDGLGWGSATGPWLEGRPVPAPSTGSSLERLPGGSAGSTQDTDDNLADFVARTVPDPQNAGSPSVPDPSASPEATTAPPSDPHPTPSPAPTTAPSGAPSSSPDPEPSPAPIAIAHARLAADGTSVTVEGVALTDSSFTDGGGYVADASAGIAVLVDDGSFLRGTRLRLSGTVDDRFSQRTLRVSGTGVTPLGTATEPAASARATGTVNEEVEGTLIELTGRVIGRPTTLTSGLAFEVDDGSGAARVIVAGGTGIDTSTWSPDSSVTVAGVVGQRDSSGTGTSGYRVQPRSPHDVGPVSQPSAEPEPSPSADGTASASTDPSATPAPRSYSTIAQARAAPKNARVRVRGTVTLGRGVVDPGSAAVQDASGAILLRLGDEAGPVARGSLIEIDGTRSTFGGMETLRITAPPRIVGRAPEPEAVTVRTGAATERHEAMLVSVRGAVVATPRRFSSGTISLEIDDGSGPLRISIGSGASIAVDRVLAGTWIEVRGVLGQETTGAEPLRGYRVWPRDAEDLRILAGPTDPEDSGSESGGAGGGPAGPGAFPGSGVGSLEGVSGAGSSTRPIGATLVAAAWPELGIGGLLWDGTRLVALNQAAAAPVERAIGTRRTPVPLELNGLHMTGTEPTTGVMLVGISAGGGAVARPGQPAAPRTSLPAGEEPAWVAIIGEVRREDGELTLRPAADGAPVKLDVRCAQRGRPVPTGRALRVLGVGSGSPARILTGCDAVQAAPRVALEVTGPGAASESRGARASSAASAPPAATSRSAGLAAGLLTGASLLTAGGVAYRRWSLRRQTTTAEEAGPGPLEDPPAAGTPLSLLRMTRE